MFFLLLPILVYSILSPPPPTLISLICFSLFLTFNLSTLNKSHNLFPTFPVKNR